MKRLFFRYDGPTWLVALVLYGSWAALVWFHAVLPWWVLMPVGAYVVAWHFSLQHEAIHAFLSAPRWLRWAVVMPPACGCLSRCTTRRTASTTRTRT